MTDQPLHRRGIEFIRDVFKSPSAVDPNILPLCCMTGRSLEIGFGGNYSRSMGRVLIPAPENPLAELQPVFRTSQEAVGGELPTTCKACVRGVNACLTGIELEPKGGGAQTYYTRGVDCGMKTSDLIRLYRLP
jgi:hypothetical protein